MFGQNFGGIFGRPAPGWSPSSGQPTPSAEISLKIRGNVWWVKGQVFNSMPREGDGYVNVSKLGSSQQLAVINQLKHVGSFKLLEVEELNDQAVATMDAIKSSLGNKIKVNDLEVYNYGGNRPLVYEILPKVFGHVEPSKKVLTTLSKNEFIKVCADPSVLKIPNEVGAVYLDIGGKT